MSRAITKWRPEVPINPSRDAAGEFALFVGEEVLKHYPQLEKTTALRNVINAGRDILHGTSSKQITSGWEVCMQIMNGMDLAHKYNVPSSYHPDSLVYNIADLFVNDSKRFATEVRGVRTAAEILGTPMDNINAMFTILFR